MNCARHNEVPAAAFCRTCGKALCENCKRDVRGAVYCEDCLASRVMGVGVPAGAVMGARPSGPHPAVAGVLAGFFPFGVGQVYNGQYSRGFVYLIAFIALIWGASTGGDTFGPVFGIGIAGYYFFQLIDAVRSARCLQLGAPAPDPFGLDNLFGPGAKPQPAAVPAAGVVENGTVPPAAAPVAAQEPSNVPMAALILIGLGVLFLLGNMGIFHFWVHRMWPLIILAVGGWLLVSRWDEIVSGSPQGRRKLMGPAVLLVIGSAFLLDSVGRFPFDRTWPVILIVIGLVIFWQRTAPQAVRPPEAPVVANHEPQPPQLGPGGPTNEQR